MVTIGGRTFSPEILSRPTATMNAEPGISRRQLSLRVCEWVAWRNASDRPQAMSCRKSLLQVQRRGKIVLPVPARHYAFQKARTDADLSAHRTLAELGQWNHSWHPGRRVGVVMRDA